MKKEVIITIAVICLITCAKSPENDVFPSSIKLDRNELTLEKGANYVLEVTYTPSNSTNKTTTWVSSNTSIATVSDGIVVGVSAGCTEIIAKCGDATDRCQINVVISATSIKLDKTAIDLLTGNTETIVAIVEPAGSTDGVIWETSDESVATVLNGVVTAIGGGKATITARAGIHKAECIVNAISVPEAVDLGLSVKWASFNLGASQPQDYGDYYAWGEVEPYYSSLEPLIWKDGKYAGYTYESYRWTNGKYNRLTKYCTENRTDLWDGTGTPDNKIILDLEDDAAHVILGGNWRMPTLNEQEELMTQCLWFWTSENERNGYRVTGPNGNSIFLPAAGLFQNTDLVKVEKEDNQGWYWSSSLLTGVGQYECHHAYLLVFTSYDNTRISSYSGRCMGLTIRPVKE